LTVSESSSDADEDEGAAKDSGGANYVIKKVKFHLSSFRTGYLIRFVQQIICQDLEMSHLNSLRLRIIEKQQGSRN